MEANQLNESSFGNDGEPMKNLHPPESPLVQPLSKGLIKMVDKLTSKGLVPCISVSHWQIPAPVVGVLHQLHIFRKSSVTE